MDSGRANGRRVPGGGPHRYSVPVPAAATDSLVVGFNVGFQMPAANGGYYTDGKTIWLADRVIGYGIANPS